MTLDPDTCYRAVVARDPRFDGRFFTGVTSTGIYCRPVCPARTPARANMRFFAHAGAAEAAGFRACRRCRPETSPGSPDWNVRADLAARAVRLIADGYVDAHGISGLAARLAVTQRHLHRLLVAELGAGPQALARTARLQTARRLLAETAMPVTEVAFASGFSSVRQFNASVRESSGRTPTQLRARARKTSARRTGPGRLGDRDGAGAPGTWLSLRLACREPFDAAAWLGFLAARAIPGVEQVSTDRYARTVRTAAGPGIIELIPRPGQGHVLLRARLSGLGAVGPVVGGARRLLDADADPAAIGAALAADELIAPLVAARPGLRVPGAYDGFELAVRAVLGQQVSVAAASTFAGRLAARLGVPLPAEGIPHVPSGASTDPAAEGRGRGRLPGPDGRPAGPDRGLPRPGGTGRRRPGRPRAHHGPPADPSRAGRSGRERAADPRSRRRPRRARGPAGRTARHRAVDHRLHPDARGRRPGRLPRGRSGPAPGPGPAGRTSRARCLVASMARVRGHAAVDLARPAGRRPSSANGPAPACAYGRGAARAAARSRPRELRSG